MAEGAALRKLEQERDRLAAEFKILSESKSTKDACEDLVRQVEAAPEPFAADYHKDNPWAASTKESAGCCSIQ